MILSLIYKHFSFWFSWNALRKVFEREEAVVHSLTHCYYKEFDRLDIGRTIVSEFFLQMNEAGFSAEETLSLFVGPHTLFPVISLKIRWYAPSTICMTCKSFLLQTFRGS